MTIKMVTFKNKSQMTNRQTAGIWGQPIQLVQ